MRHHECDGPARGGGEADQGLQQALKHHQVPPGRASVCFDDEEHEVIEEELREIVKEKFEDPNVIDKMLGTLRDSVSLVGDLFDVVRKKSADGAKK